MNNRIRMSIKACIVAKKWKLNRYKRELMTLMYKDGMYIYYNGEILGHIGGGQRETQT